MARGQSVCLLRSSTAEIRRRKDCHKSKDSFAPPTVASSLSDVCWGGLDGKAVGESRSVGPFVRPQQEEEEGNVPREGEEISWDLLSSA